MPRKKSNKGRYNFLIDSTVYGDFSKLCDELGLVRAKKVENYMKRFIEDNISLLKRLKNEK